MEATSTIRAYVHRTSLFQRLFVIGLLLFAAVLFLVTYVTREATRATVERINRDRLHSAEVTAETLDEIMRHAIGELQGVQRLADFDPASPDMSQERFILQVLSDQGSAFGEGMAFVDTRGRVLVSVPGDAFGTDGSSPDRLPGILLGSAVSTADTYVSPVFSDPRGGSPLVFVSVPIITTSGSPPRGYLFGAVNPMKGRLIAVLRTATSRFPSGHADLLDSAGMTAASTEDHAILTRGDHPDFYAARSAAHTAGLSTIPEEEGDHTAYPPEDNHVMAFVPLSGLPWALSLGASESDTYAPVRQFQTRVYLLTMAVLTLGFIGALLGSLQLVRPVRSLSHAARRMAEGDLEAPIAVREGGEIGALSQDLDQMRTRLRASVEEIHGLNRDLEQRIAERTREVEQQNRELLSASAIAESLSGSLHLQQVLETALDKVAEATGQEMLAIFLLGNDAKEMRLAAARGLREPFTLWETAVACGDCLCGQVVVQGQPGIVQDITSSPVMTRTACAAAGVRSVAAFPLYARDRAQGALVFFATKPGGFPQHDFRFVTLICHQLGMAIQNARLFGELEEKEKQARQFLEKVINAQEEERKRLARELHDETGQTLTAIALSLESLEATLPVEWTVARERLGSLRQTTREALDELRKMVLALRPSALDDLGLVPAVRRYALQHLEPLGVTVDIEAKGIDRGVDPTIQTLLFRIVQEAINNVARHSRARQVSIRFWQDGDGVWAVVQDDGQGFNPKAIVRDYRSSTGLGLLGMQERANLAGGRVEVQSDPGKGTRVIVSVPLKSGGGDS